MDETHIKNMFFFWAMVLTGVIFGGLLGEVAAQIPSLAFLNYGKSIGISPDAPLVLDLTVVRLVLGFQLKMTVAAIIGLITSVILYKKVL